MLEKVSIIIPTYNVEKYIERCLQSVISQTYKNIQVIVIDDGSEDNTTKIAQEMKAKTTEGIVVQLITNNSKGVSSARNAGLDFANGKYVMFLDSDDFMDNKMVEQMVNYISDVDLATCDYINAYDNSNDNNNQAFIETNNKYTIEEYLNLTALDFNSLYVGVLWNKIFRLDIIRENDIRFDESIQIGEDSVFNLDYYKCINSVFVGNGHYYYHYMDNDKSLTKTIPPVMIWDMSVPRYEKMIDMYKENDLLDNNKEKIGFRILGDLLLPIEDVIKNDKGEQELQQICDKDIVRFAFRYSNKQPLLYRIIRRGVKTNNYKKLYKRLKRIYKVK